MTKETKHTPGPWYLRPEEPSVEAECPTEPGFFSTIADCGKSRTLSNEQMQANAELIASAPDLLAQRDELREALQRLMDLHDDAVFACGVDDQNKVGVAHQIARKALSRCAAPEAPKGWKEVEA